MSKIGLVVEFHVKPARRDDFLKHIRDHARGTLAEEEGCLHFDVLVPKEAQDGATDRKEALCRVFLYEVYRDDAAIQAHSANPRLAKTRDGYKDMIESRNITRCEVQD